MIITDDYAKDGGPGVVRLSCSFYREPLRSLIVKKTSITLRFEVRFVSDRGQRLSEAI